MVKMIPISMNGYGPLLLPKHRQKQWENPWEKERIDSLHANVLEGDVVYYVGAEEGDMPALLASWGAQMVLIEPSVKYWPAIIATWEMNDLEPPLATFQGFAANELSSEGQVFYGGFPPIDNNEIIPFAGFSNLSERPDIPRVKLDLIAFSAMHIPSEPPDIISIDTEGSELEVLKGAIRILQEKRPLVYVSVHPQFLQDMYNQTQEQLFEFMEALSYEKILLADVHERHFALYAKEGISSRRFIQS